MNRFLRVPFTAAFPVAIVRWIASGVLVVTISILSGCASQQAVPQVTDTNQATAEPSPQNLEMIRALTQLNELKEELKLLRNSVEEMQFQQETADRRQQDLFKDIDGRLLSLERSGQQLQSQVQQQPVLTPSGEVLAQGQTNAEVVDANTSLGASAGTSQVTSVNVVSATQNRSISSIESGSSSVSLTEQEAYDSAFEMLKQSRYQDAVEQFQAMVNTWPDSPLADDALYWMAEANYVNRYPDSARLPEAMLKVGYIQYDIGAYDQAATTFRDILARFPGHQVTVSAETRLRRIEQTIQ